MATKEEQARDAELQAIAELHRNGAEVFQSALGQLAIVTGQLAGVVQATLEANRPPDARTLDERMAAVQLELEDVPRRGHAEVEMRSGGRYSYDYITEADLMKAIRPLLAKHGIATYYSDRIVSIEAGMATVEVTLLLRAAGDQIALTGEGVGTDFGDKHANKAKTSAVRYLLWKTFLQPSDEDPEQDNVSAAEAAGAAAGRAAAAERQTTQRTQRRGAQTPEQRKGGLIQRLTTLAIELDEVQGKTPGSTQGKLYEDVQQEHGVPVPEIDEAALVEIGKALADHVGAQREIAEAGGEAVELFAIPRPQAA